MNRAGPCETGIPVEYRFSDARRRAGRIKRQFDEALAAKQATCQQDGARDLVMEVKYFKLLSDLYEKNVNLMDSVVAYLNHEIANGRKTEQAPDRFFCALIKWLENMETEMRRVLHLPSSAFGEMFEDLRRGVGRFLKELGKSMAVQPEGDGAAVGAFGGAVLKSICYAFGTEDPHLQEEVSNSFKDVHEEVENLKQALAGCEDDALERELLKIAKFWDHFETFNPNVDNNDCPICLGPLQQPVLFRGCAGRHFHCRECRAGALAKHSGGGRCSICREVAPGPR